MNGGGGRVVQCNIEESRGKRGSLATLTHFYVCLSVRLPAWVTCHVAGGPRPRASQGHGRIPHRANTVYWLWPWCLMPYRHTRLYAFLFASLLASGVVSRVCRSKARDVKVTVSPLTSVCLPAYHRIRKALFTFTRVILLVWLPDLQKVALF